ncbi:MAG: hypothetical protein JNL68_18070 [Burkholderiales bacterium]|nr:hypothetical protein [Burkholderiales bacterium]
MHAATWESLNRFAEQGELEVACLRCEIHAPRRAVATQRVQFEVAADPGTRVRAWLQWADGNAPLDVDASGCGSFIPARPGIYRVVVQAESELLSFLAPVAAEAEASVVVVAPPVAIEVAHRVARGAAGATACFRWDIKGAERVELRAPRRDQVLAVPACGGIDVDIDVLAESFQLVAVAMDGVEHETELATHPVAAQSDADVHAVLRLLDSPWS